MARLMLNLQITRGPDGFDVSILIRQQSKINQTTHILAVTAHNEHEYSENAKSQKMDDYFTKPCTAEDAKSNQCFYYAGLASNQMI